MSFQTWTTGLAGQFPQTFGTRILVAPVCPDLLDYAAIGGADNLRGKVVRAFFWLMQVWPT